MNSELSNTLNYECSIPMQFTIESNEAVQF